jgi:hypothetical protein
VIASTGPHISQGRFLIIIIALILGACILSGQISRQAKIDERKLCQQVNKIFAGSHYIYDEADGICKPEEV